MKKKVLNLGNFVLKGTWSDCSNKEDESSVIFSLDTVIHSNKKSIRPANRPKDKNKESKERITSLKDLGSYDHVASRSPKESSDISTIVATNTTTSIRKIASLQNVATNNSIRKIASLQDLEDYDCFDHEEETLQEPSKGITSAKVFKNSLFKTGWFKNFGLSSKKGSNSEVTSEATNYSTDSSDICSDGDVYSEEKDRPLLGLEWLVTDESRQAELGYI